MTLWAHRSPSMTSRIGAKMMNVALNYLNSRHSLRFPRTRGDAIIYARRGPQTMGQGHNGAQNENPSVVPSVVGKRRLTTAGYPLPTTPQRQTGPLSCVCAHACARTRATPFFRCGVVTKPYDIDIYRERGTTLPTTLGQKGQKPLWVALWAALNPLLSNKKGVFEHG